MTIPQNEDVPARVDDAQDSESLTRTTTGRHTIQLVGVLLILQLCFVGSYLGAFLSTSPESVPVALVTPPDATPEQARSMADQLGALPGTPMKIVTAGDQDAANRMVDDQKVNAALVMGRTGETDQLIVAAAADPDALSSLVSIVNQVEQQLKRTGKITLVHPMASGDPRGMTGLLLMLSWLVGAAGFAVLIGEALRSGAQRLAALAGYGLASAAAGVLIAAAFAAIAGNVGLLLLTGTLFGFAVGALVLAAHAWGGRLAAMITVGVIAVLGIPGAGALPSAAYLPPLWRATGPYLPPGAGTDALRGSAYFAGHGTLVPLLVLVGYAVVGAGVYLLKRPVRPAAEEPAPVVAQADA